jgi:hypothetical protein
MNLRACRCGEPWNVKMALHLRQTHGVSYAWLAKNPSLGIVDPARSLLRHEKEPKILITRPDPLDRSPVYRIFIHAIS